MESILNHQFSSLATVSYLELGVDLDEVFIIADSYAGIETIQL